MHPTDVSLKTLKTKAASDYPSWLTISQDSLHRHQTLLEKENAGVQKVICTEKCVILIWWNYCCLVVLNSSYKYSTDTGSFTTCFTCTNCTIECTSQYTFSVDHKTMNMNSERVKLNKIQRNKKYSNKASQYYEAVLTLELNPLIDVLFVFMFSKIYGILWSYTSCEMTWMFMDDVMKNITIITGWCVVKRHPDHLIYQLLCWACLDCEGCVLSELHFCFQLLD